MKHLLIIPFILLITQMGISQQSTFQSDLQEKFEGQIENLNQCISLLSQKDLDAKPNNENMNARDLVIHICRNMTWISQDYLQGGTFESPYDHKDLSLEELKNYVDLATTFALNSLKGVKVQNLNTKVDFFAGEKNIRQMMELMDDHLSHHKGQLTVYLRFFGKEPPRYRGW